MPAPGGTRSVVRPEAPKETAVARLLIAPITFISFLLSLALIDSRNASLRSHIHSSSHPAGSNGIYGRLKSTLHSWVYRPQPYAYVRSPETLQRQKSGEGGGVQQVTEREEPWHWNANQKKMMKMEVVDAFEVRTRVVLAMAVVVAVFAALVVWVVNYVYDMIIMYM